MNKSTLTKDLIKILMAITIGLSVSLFQSPPKELLPSRLSLDLPSNIGIWQGEKRRISDQEYKILAKDTDFKRMRYIKKGDRDHPGIIASIVLSGNDLNNSIHRPERCLVAQGWNIIGERYLTVDVRVNNKVITIPLKELVYEIAVNRKKGEKIVPLLTPEGKVYKERHIQFYTFFGNKKIVSGHYERTWEDSIIGRVIGGYAQRWAYATFSMPVTQAIKEQNMNDNRDKYFTDDEVRKELKSFIKEMLPTCLDK